MHVERSTRAVCEEWVKTKHYTRRLGIFWEGFHLVESDRVLGVCVFGQPSPNVQRSAFTERDFQLLELSRLVVQTPERNAASLLVGRSLQMLTSPCAVVSYADTAQGHCGIVYQATNWIYTGATVSHDKLYLVNGVRTHPMTLRDQGITSPAEWARENNIPSVRPSPKHRYFFLCGNKRERRDMLAKLSYPVVTQYPKAERSRYDDGPEVSTFLNARLFA